MSRLSLMNDVIYYAMNADDNSIVVMVLPTDEKRVEIPRGGWLGYFFPRKYVYIMSVDIYDVLYPYIKEKIKKYVGIRKLEL